MVDMDPQTNMNCSVFFFSDARQGGVPGEVVPPSAQEAELAAEAPIPPFRRDKSTSLRGLRCIPRQSLNWLMNHWFPLIRLAIETLISGGTELWGV